MILRDKPLKLEQLEILKCRAGLAGDEAGELGNLQLGWEGERTLDLMIDALISGRDCVHLKDYRFLVNEGAAGGRKVARNSSEIQIDNILITGDRIFTFEVKKYHFDLIYAEGAWTFTSGEKFKDLMQQVSRQNDAFRQLLERSGSGIDVYSCLVFINPKQTIYNLPYGKNILTHSSLEKFLERTVRGNHYSYDRLVSFLKSRQVLKSMYDGTVNVGLEELGGGVFCENCYRALERVHRNRYHCSGCEQNFDLLTVTRRLIAELRMLNEGWKLSSYSISKYSGGLISSSYIRTQKKLGKVDY